MENPCMGVFIPFRLTKEQINRLYFAVTQQLGLQYPSQAKWHPFNGHDGGFQFFEPRDSKDVANALKLVLNQGECKYQIKLIAALLETLFLSLFVS
jgi:hypothetical protein